MVKWFPGGRFQVWDDLGYYTSPAVITSPGGISSCSNIPRRTNSQLRTPPPPGGERYERSKRPHLMFEPCSGASTYKTPKRPPPRNVPPAFSLHFVLNFYRVCFSVLMLYSHSKFMVSFSKKNQLQQSRANGCTLLRHAMFLHLSLIHI